MGYSLHVPHCFESLNSLFSSCLPQRSGPSEILDGFTHWELEKLIDDLLDVGWPLPQLASILPRAAPMSFRQFALLHSLPVCLGQVSAQLVGSDCDDDNDLSAFPWIVLPQLLVDKTAFAEASNSMHTIEWERETILNKLSK